ncbi:MAG: hypothetical protein AB1567_07065 [bacterium]
MAREISVFTDKRRELLARTLMDITKIVIAAAFASEFFFKFAIWLRILLLCGIGLTVILGILVCPKDERKE